ncbi:MAG TPA: hypothetical protein VJ831_05190 [Jatrophihabitantaceae bacterium]|nr:hypothetical protein [Jatrophihabitantaceae bacterium]
MTPRYRAISPDELRRDIADRLASMRPHGPALRVAVDGPDCATPQQFAQSLVDPLQERGRPATVLRADAFWRDASLRLEFGRTDVESLPSWLDAAALTREVLHPLGEDGTGTYLPSLRDPETNRSTRTAPVTARPGEIVIVAGAFLLGAGLDFDMTVHLAVSAGARERLTPATEQWTLPALIAYDARERPAAVADIVIRYDDPARPAVAA